MHFNVVVKFAALTVLLFNTGLVAAAPTDSSDHDTDPNPGFQGQVAFVNSWAEAGFTRYRFNFTGVDGDVFKSAFQSCGGITYNWQSYTQDGHGVFDDSELVGSAGTKVITCGIQDVTGVALDCDSISQNQC